MKNLTSKIFILLLWIIIALIPLSCGTRKSVTKIEKNAEIVTVKEESKGQVKKVEEKKEVVKEVAKVEKKDENKTVVVTELFNDNGMIKSRVKEVNVNKSTNNTSNSKSLLKTLYKNTDSVFNNHYYHNTEITKYIKDKAVTTDRNGLYWMLGIIGVIGLLLWLKPWRK